MVAGVNVAVVLNRNRFTAVRQEQTESRTMARPNAEGNIKHLHEHATHIPAHPGVEDGGQEVAVSLGRHAPVGDR